MASNGSTGSREGRNQSSVLADYLDQIQACRRRGEEVDVEAMAQGDAGLARELKAMLSTLDVVERHSSAGGTLAAGRVLGDFRIERELGRGGMGVVYLARDTRLDRQVALKFLPVQAALDNSLRERFRREARAAGKLGHPSIVPVHGLGEQEGLLFLIMQYVEGQSLDRAVRGTPLPAHQTARLGERLADALSYAHSHGIVHRDIKPGNVILSADGNPWITDFGLCELRGEEQLTRSNAVLGTPRYMAPEQLKGQSSAQSDVYGLGATLYEALTGKPPYADEPEGRASYRERLAHPPRRPRRIEPSIPKALEAIVRKAMAPLPEQRYTGARAFRQDLSAFLSHRPVEAQPPGPTDILRLAYRRNRLASWILGSAAALLVALSLVYVQNLRGARESEMRRAYAATIAAASAAFQANDEDLARKSLDAAPEALRAWEWRHLRARLGAEASRLAELGERIFSLELSGDGRWIAAGLSRRVLVIDREDPERRFEFEHRADVWGAAISADSRQLVSCDFMGRVLRIKLDPEPALVASGQLPLPMPRTITLAPDGERVAIGFFDGSIREFDPEWEPLGARRVVHASRVYDLTYLREGDALVSCGADGTLRLLDLDSGQHRLLARHEGPLHDVDLHPHEPWIAVGGEGGLVEVREGRTGRLLEGWRMGGARFVSDVHFAGGGRYVVAPGDQDSITVWRVGQSERPTVHSVPDGSADGLAWDPLRGTVLSAGQLGSIQEHDLFHPGGLLHARPHVGAIRAMTYFPGGKRLAAAGNDTNVTVLDARTGRIQALLRGHLRYATALAVDPDERWLASGDEGGHVLLWDLADMALAARTAAGTGGVRDLAFTADGQRLLVARAGQPLERLEAPSLAPAPWTLADSANTPEDVDELISTERFLAVVRDAEISLHDPDLTWRWSRDLDGHIGAVDVRPDGRALVCGTRTGQVIELDVEGGARIGGFELRAGAPAPARNVLDLAYHPVEGHLVIVTERMKPLLVDPRTGDETLLLSGLLETATCVAVSPSGGTIACGGKVGDLVLWDELDTMARRLAEGEARVPMETSEALEASASPAGIEKRLRALCVRDDASADELMHGFLMAQEWFHHVYGKDVSYYLMNRIQARRGQVLARGRLESMAHSEAEPRAEIYLTYLLTLLDRGLDERARREAALAPEFGPELLEQAFSPSERSRLEDLLGSIR